MSTSEILDQLEAQRDAIDAAISALNGNRQKIGRPKGKKTKRTMSAEARKRISNAQKARWKAQKANAKA